MKRYRNLAGSSGVSAYALQPGAIIVRFQGGDTYEYTDASAGAAAIAQMQRLASEGRGLSTFIARHKPPFSRKLP